MAVFLDGVFSHTGSDSIYFNREGRYGEGGAYRDPQSPYREWYRFRQDGSYQSWWNFDSLPEVEEENPSYQAFIPRCGGALAGAGGLRFPAGCS